MKNSICKLLSKAAFFAALLFLVSGVSSAKPVESDGSDFPIKCGTFASPERRNQIAKTYESDTATGRPICQAHYHSPNGKFFIHYDTTGVHAVDLKDANLNSVPDYVDSVAYYFEFVAQKYMDLGMPSPYPDDGKGGDSCYDIYLKDLGDADKVPVNGNIDVGGVYGLTELGKQIDSSQPEKYESYIILDNNFSELDTAREYGKAPRPAYRETGILGMKVTAAHEYFHAVQFLYGIENITGRLISEMMSVYMEYTLFPESRDHVQYVNAMLKRMGGDNNDIYFGNPSALSGYAFSVFVKYITLKYGEESVPQIWEIMSKNNFDTYETYDAFFKTKGTDLKRAWMDFIPYLYFTGERAREGYLPLAKEYSTLKPYKNIIYKYPETTYTNVMKPYEVYLIRYQFPISAEYTNDTLDLLYTNNDQYSPSHLQYDKQTDYTFIIKSSDLGTEGDPLFDYDPPKHYLTYSSGNGLVDYVKFEGKGVKIMSIVNAYPTPLQLKKDLIVYFPAPENTPAYSVCNLNIMDLSGATLFTQNYKSGVYDGKKALVVETSSLENKIGVGVYLFSVESGNNRVVGKFAVKEK
ncbi:MAG: MXAN_6640 family putative metalloprotease [Chloroflexota bacterium]